MKKQKKDNWKDVDFYINGKKINGVKPVTLEVKGMEVNEILGLFPVFKVKKSKKAK